MIKTKMIYQCRYLSRNLCMKPIGKTLMKIISKIIDSELKCHKALLNSLKIVRNH